VASVSGRAPIAVHCGVTVSVTETARSEVVGAETGRRWIGAVNTSVGAWRR
jgi:hypothetical protein